MGVKMGGRQRHGVIYQRHGVMAARRGVSLFNGGGSRLAAASGEGVDMVPAARLAQRIAYLDERRRRKRAAKMNGRG